MTLPLTQSNDISAATLANQLVAWLRERQSVAVAFSGGVDSAVVAKAAVLALGTKAVAVTAVSPSLAKSELVIAREEARLIGIRHVEISTDEFDNPSYRANAGDRCFFCKDTLYSLTAKQLEGLGVDCMVNGSNTDDLGDYRPGMQAAKDHSVFSPLIEVGCNKARVRELARHWQLSVAEKLASPCLSSRVAYGVEVTEERVRRIELAEAFLRQMLGEVELRVRVEHNDLARIEVAEAAIERLVVKTTRKAITAELLRLGFKRVTIDLNGFRSGSMNDSLQFVALGVDAK